jgi:tetratricopeptide (TPR) repeat protein
MRADCLVVQICEFVGVGDDVYRFHGPSESLAGLPGVVTIDVTLHHRHLPELAEQADVLILGGFDNDWFPRIQRRRAAGRLTILEANDYYPDLQPWNPLSARWIDRPLQDSFRHGLLLCDAVQTSTPELARRWREITTVPVVAFPNQLSAVTPLPTRDLFRPLTVGWGGSPGHFADWFAHAPGLQRWLDAHPNVHLGVMCNEFIKPFIQLSPDRYHFRPFGSLRDFYDFLATLDIGIAPLLPTDYNRCRSDVKFLEYALHGVVGIYPDLEPYRDSVEHGKTGLLYRTQEELWAALDRLATNAELRETIRQNAYEHVSKQRRIDQYIGARMEFYRSLRPAGFSGTTLSSEIIESAIISGQYLQIRPGPAEEVLKAQIDAEPSQESIAKLRHLTEQLPRYALAWQTLGRHHNGLQETTEALSALKIAKGFDSQSARTRAEIARTHFLSRRLPEARGLLEETLKVNPYSAITWQYFLKLLVVTRAPDVGPWLKFLRQCLPANLGLVLVGVPALPPREAVAVLGELLDDHGQELYDDERPRVTTAFSETVRSVVAPVLREPATLMFLKRACATFPDSVVLADLHARALHSVGDASALDEWRRAAQLRRVAQTYNAERPREDGTFHLWQFAEHIQRWGEKEESMNHRATENTEKTEE